MPEKAPRPADSFPLRMGRISYLNVLPIYHPLESGVIQHDFEIVSGPPALLNEMMASGILQVSSCSCFEYGRNPDKYYLAEDLSIGSDGPVMSVLLLSREPISGLAGKEILISGESHTSVALLRLLMRDFYRMDVSYRTGRVTPELASAAPPAAFLAIGDEALRLRRCPQYPYCLDLAEAWRRWTGLPFVFGLWVISADAAEKGLFSSDPGQLLRDGRDWGLGHMDLILDLTACGCPLAREELREYYEKGLFYTLRGKQLDGLKFFYKKLAAARLIEKEPELRFFEI